MSATEVRALAAAGRWEALSELVPEATAHWFAQAENRTRFLARLEDSI